MRRDLATADAPGPTLRRLLRRTLHIHTCSRRWFTVDQQNSTAVDKCTLVAGLQPINKQHCCRQMHSRRWFTVDQQTALL